MSDVGEKLVLDEGKAALGDASEENLLWRPQNIEHHKLTKLRLLINKKYNVNLEDYHQLHGWSVQNYGLFWSEVWKFSGVISSVESEKAIDTSVPMNDIPEWFPGARLNYAENLLRYPDDSKIALYFTTERFGADNVKTQTFGQLRDRVRRYAASLKKLGVKEGDRVVGYIPNCPEAIEAMAATASLGAIWSSTSPDFGVSGVLDRFSQIKPKVVFSVEAVSYNMKTHDHLGKLSQVVNKLEDVEKVVVIPFVHEQQNIDLSSVKNSLFLEEFLQCGTEEDGSIPPLEYKQVPFNHPLFIMYSSGTTGAPKCMVHSVGGTLLKHLEEHLIQGSRDETDTLLYYTTTGWMMWNWEVSALATGCSLVLYDGSPLHPHTGVMWDLVDKCGITVFGTSAKWIAVQEDRGLKPRTSHSLATLKAICSTGSPLTPKSYDYVYRDIKANILLASISGGTDIIACFMGENSVLPVYRGEIQSPHLGCGIQAWDEGGNSVEGEPGELVCTAPFPSMPTKFWNDEDGQKYQNAYFNKFDGIWAHGDFMLVSPKTKGILMLGRSDGTLNPSGVRFGSAEIYNIVDEFDEISDSVCVGQRTPDRSEERVVLFLKMVQGDLTADLVKRLSSTIRSRLSARHVPALILPISDIPYTVNGKKVEVAIKRILVGEEVRNKGALANPECLELYKNIPETKVW